MKLHFWLLGYKGCFCKCDENQVGLSWQKSEKYIAPSLFIPISTSFPSSNFFILVLPHLELFLISLSCPCDTSASSSLTLHLYLTLTISPSSFVHLFCSLPSIPSINTSSLFPHIYLYLIQFTLHWRCLSPPPPRLWYLCFHLYLIHPSAELHGMLVSPSPLFITSLHLFLINLMFFPIFTSSSVLYFYLILIHSSNYLTLSSFIIPLSLPHSSIFVLYLHFPLLDFLHLSTFSSPSLHQLITQLHGILQFLFLPHPFMST